MVLGTKIRGRKRDPEAVRRKSWRDQRANAVAPPTWEALARRLEMAGIDTHEEREEQRGGKRVIVRHRREMADMIREIDKAQLRGVSMDFSLDVLRWWNERDMRNGVAENLRRGITDIQWRAGWRLASIRYAEFGLPASASAALFRQMIQGDPRPLPRDLREGETAEDAQARRRAERMASYGEAMRALDRLGARVRDEVVSVCVFWRLLPVGEAVRVQRLRAGLNAVAGRFGIEEPKSGAMSRFVPIVQICQEDGGASGASS
jgi:hypothetical protein